MADRSRLIQGNARQNLFGVYSHTNCGSLRGVAMTIPATVSHAVQQTQEWLKALRDTGGYADETEALAVLRSVLHQLRDRLTPQEAVDLGAQLPMIVRGVYYEGWRPSKTPERIRSQQEFLEGVSGKLAPHPLGAEPATRDVFSLLAQTLDSGEIADVINQLPADIKALWPDGMRIWATKRGAA
jgi:uncharacterized protein (DUF2267 family)